MIRRMNQPPPPIMHGGSKAHIFDMLNKHSSIINMYIISILTISIVFVKEIPLSIRAAAGSSIGRFVLFFGTITLADQYSWISGLLLAILSLLILSLGPRTMTEGFQSAHTSTIKLITDKEKWWVERVFKENPIGIEEENVNTKQIQDGSNGSSSTTGQGGSHH